MKKYFTFHYLFSSMLLTMLASCGSKDSSPVAEEMTATITPVSVISVNSGPMESYIELNATSQFQQKWIIKSNVNGYLQLANVQLHKFVHTGQSVFTVKTKEAQSIGNTISILDSSFHFSGVNTIRANGNGFISEINHQAGDYVQDGEQLAVITDTRSFVFLLDLPYEMRPYLVGKSSVQLLLPDGEKMNAYFSGSMPMMDSASQTQRVILKVHTDQLLPENLIARIRLLKNQNEHAYYIPKAAVLTDETQENFWVMKLINDSMAAKVIIKKGIESGDQVEIVQPVFSGTDKILVTGNYGLADTAKVKVLKQ